MNIDVENVLAVIRAAGGHPLIVGGFVRDNILGLESKDIDIEVYGITADELLPALQHVSVVKEAGKSFGVFKVRRGETDMDVSLPRTESKTGAGHRGFTVIPDSTLGMREASARRDFTINAIMFDPENGQIIDLHGGLEDLDYGILRHTSDAFGDDPLRVMRAIQFVARFGFSIHPATVDECFRLKGEFSTLSKERIWTEWEKIGTKGTFITKALDSLFETDWVGHFPELVLVPFDNRADFTARRADAAGFKGEDRLVVMFAPMLAETSEKIARAFLERIGCPEHIIKRIVPLVDASKFRGLPTPANVRKLSRKLWPATLAELDVIDPSHEWLQVALDEGVTHGPAKPLLTGDHLIAAGHKPGPSFSPILRAALDAQDAGEFSTEEGAVKWMEDHV